LLKLVVEPQYMHLHLSLSCIC